MTQPTTYRIETEYITMRAARITVGRYSTGGLALSATETDLDSPTAGTTEHLTVNLIDHGIIASPGHIWVRDYSEHTGLPAALETAGLATIIERRTIGPFNSPVAHLALN